MFQHAIAIALAQKEHDHEVAQRLRDFPRLQFRDALTLLRMGGYSQDLRDWVAQKFPILMKPWGRTTLIHERPWDFSMDAVGDIPPPSWSTDYSEERSPLSLRFVLHEMEHLSVVEAAKIIARAPNGLQESTHGRVRVVRRSGFPTGHPTATVYLDGAEVAVVGISRDWRSTSWLRKTPIQIARMLHRSDLQIRKWNALRKRDSFRKLITVLQYGRGSYEVYDGEKGGSLISHGQSWAASEILRGLGKPPGDYRDLLEVIEQLKNENRPHSRLPRRKYSHVDLMENQGY